MSTDNNKLSLKVIGSPQPADNSSTIEAEAVAYIDAGTGVITYPDPVEVVFELPKGSGALFTDTNAETTSRKTLKASGRIQTPVYFKSSQAIDNGILQAYWQADPANTLQQKPFSFQSAGAPSHFYLEMTNKTFAGLGGTGEWMGDGTLLICSKTTPDDSCKFVMESNGDGTFSVKTSDGRYWAIESDWVGTLPRAVIASSQRKDAFIFDYSEGRASMTIQWGGYYVSFISGGLPDAGLIAAVKKQLDPFCYFTVSSW
jgi:hypothetical protein